MADKFDGYHNTWYGKPLPFEVPSYKKYNSIEGIWQLEYTRDKLAKYGLKDPWMRNEIFRYPSWYQLNPLSTALEILCGKKCIGLKYGFALAAGIIISQNIYWRLRYGERPLHAENLLDWLEELRTHRGIKNQ